MRDAGAAGAELRGKKLQMGREKERRRSTAAIGAAAAASLSSKNKKIKKP